MKRKTFTAMCAAVFCSTALFGVSGGYPVSATAKDWNNFRFFSRPNKNCTVSNLEENGKQILRVTYTKTPGIKDLSPCAYRQFVPFLDTEKHSNFRCKVRFSQPVSTASVGFYYKGWQKEGWKKMQVVSLGESIRAKILPAGQWLNFDVALKYKDLDRIMLGLRVADFKDGAQVIADFRDMEFYAPEVDESLAAKRLEWQNFVKNFKADYSDGSALMGPPSGNRFPTPVSIVKNGQPMVEIWFNKRYNGTPVEVAAKDLQYHIKLMTGVELPINRSLRKNGVTKIVLGRSHKTTWRPFLFRKELAELFNTDGFLIRKIGNELFVLGHTDKGTMNGVYTLLENNTDIIWARPNRKFGTVCSTGLKNLDFVWGENVLEKPASKFRGYLVFSNEAWQARNRCNIMGGGGGDNYWAFASAKPYGQTVFYARGGHNIGEFVAANDPKGDIPSFFGLVNGKRKRGNHVCFSNPQMRKTFIQNFLDSYRRFPDDITGPNLWLDDTWDWCECPGCNAPVKLANGTVVDRKDPAYTSTVAFLFFNEIATAYAKEFPGKKMRVGAYWQTAEPPKCEVHPILIPMFCPYVRANDKAPIYSKENIIWLDRLQRWSKKVKQIDIYGYNALGLIFPRPLAHTHQRDFREIYKYATGMQAEGGGFMWDGIHPYDRNYFDYSAIEYWVMTRLYWNPEQDVEKLYKQFCYRTFREAAVPMEKFYGTIREEFLRSPLTTACGERGTSATNDYIIQTGKEKILRSYLEQAEKLAVHPNSKKIIGTIRNRFEFFIALVKNNKRPSITLPLIRPSEPVTLQSSVWNGAAKLNHLSDFLKPENVAKNKTQTAMFHDAKNIYFRITCFEPDMKSMSLTKNTDKEFIGGTHVEVFLADAKTPGVYYLFSVTADGKKADLKAYDKNWNSHWRSESRMFDKGYEVMIVVPLKDLNANLNEISQLKGTIIREVYGKTQKDTEYSSWQGGKHHQPHTFGIFHLMK